MLREQREAQHGRRHRWAWVAAGAAAISLLLVAFPATRGLAERYASACVNLFGKLSGSEPSLSYTELKDRRVAPDFSFADSSGADVRLSQFRGKVVLVTFWKTDCAACNTENTWFTEFQETYDNSGFAVLSYRVPAGGDDVARLYGGLAFLPTTLLIDREGRIAVTHIGLCSKREYQDAIQSLLNEH